MGNKLKEANSNPVFLLKHNIPHFQDFKSLLFNRGAAFLCIFIHLPGGALTKSAKKTVRNLGAKKKALPLCLARDYG